MSIVEPMSLRTIHNAYNLSSGSQEGNRVLIGAWVRRRARDIYLAALSAVTSSSRSPVPPLLPGATATPNSTSKIIEGAARHVIASVAEN